MEEKERMKLEAMKEKECKRIARVENQKQADRLKELKRSASNIYYFKNLKIDIGTYF